MTARSLQPRHLVAVAVALLLLLAATAVVAQHDFGPLNVVIALGIAGLKAALVMAFFMELRWSRPVVRLAAAAGFFWLAILIGMTLGDVLTRHSV